MTKLSTKSIRLLPATLALATTLSALTLITACDFKSPNSVSRTVSANVEGIYANRTDDGCDNNGRFVSANTGSAVTSMNVRQIGDQLEAIDSNGIIFRGTIGAVFGTSVPYTLEGVTTAGNPVTVSGSFDVADGGSTMRGTWIEDSLFGTLCGTSEGQSINQPPPQTNTNVASFRMDYHPMTPVEMAAHYKTALWFYEG